MESIKSYYRTNRLAVSAIVLLLLFAAIYLATQYQPGEYQTKKAELGQISSDIEASGVLSARQSVALAWQAGGVVERVGVKVGTPVTQGQQVASLRLQTADKAVLLAWSDMHTADKELANLRDPKPAIGRALNDLVNAKHDLEDAQTEYDGITGKRGSADLNEYLQDDIDEAQARLDRLEWLWKLFYEKLPDSSQSKLEMIVQMTQAKQNIADQVARYNWFNGHPDEDLVAQKLAKLNIAKGKLADAQRAYDKISKTGNADEIGKAQAKYDAARSQATKLWISSPINGTVTDLQVLPGDMVKTGTYAVRIEDLSEIGVDLMISEVDIPNIQPGMGATLHVHGADDATFQGTVGRVDLVGRNQDGVMSYKVRISVNEPDERLRSGMSVEVVIKVASFENALIIPSAAIRFYEGQRLIFVLRDGQAVPVQVRVGALNGEQAQVVGGNIKAGDQVILNPPSMNEIEPSLIQ